MLKGWRSVQRGWRSGSLSLCGSALLSAAWLDPTCPACCSCRNDEGPTRQQVNLGSGHDSLLQLFAFYTDGSSTENMAELAATRSRKTFIRVKHSRTGADPSVRL